MSIIRIAEDIVHNKVRAVAKLVAEINTFYQNGPEHYPNYPKHLSRPPSEELNYPRNSNSHTFGPSDPDAQLCTTLAISRQKESCIRIKETLKGAENVEKDIEVVGRVPGENCKNEASVTGDLVSADKLGKPRLRDEKSSI
ncbi:hypothetical protein DSL72_004429 [Monilinia vaccinii-corymbosi]|uniref:Uncharacterized protein n=1 Tax=Monilinia vaccinii-corymbosi TaxID=61207 RepID=A0A8A3P4L8_9HELO|nr:hypothetical protein DSL72_004429 [Monilinia vaccinii-corymbosi]